MCGIFCLLNYDGQFSYDTINEGFQKGQKRGPEFSTLKNIMIKCIFGFHRLAINGLNEESHQPLIVNDVAVICNGEIYNYKKLYKLLDIEEDITTDSDCEEIIHLYLKMYHVSNHKVFLKIHQFQMYLVNYQKLHQVLIN